MTSQFCHLQNDLIVSVANHPERFDLLQVTVQDARRHEIDSAVIETEVMIGLCELLPSFDRQAFLVLADGYYDSWFESWCLGYEIVGAGRLREIARIHRGRHTDRMQFTAEWVDNTMAVVTWHDALSPEPVARVVRPASQVSQSIS